MKGVDTLIASVLILIISITAIFLALQLGGPSTQRTKEALLIQEGKNTLVSIDNSIKNVLAEGEGSTRVLKFSISGGYYKIDNSTNSVIFSMESMAQIISERASKIEDGINFTAKAGMVYLNLSYDVIQVIGECEFGRGYHTLTIRNSGYNSTTQKQMIYISLTPIAPPPTLVTFTNRYNQTQTVVVIGTNTTSPANLNSINGLTYNVTEAIVFSGGSFIYQKRPNTNDTTLTDCTNKQNAYNYDGIVAICNGGGIRIGGYWWSNTLESSSETINNAVFGVRLNTSGMRINDNYWIEYGFASTPGSCTSVGSWITITTNQFPGSTLRWYNISNTTAVTWTNINNTCFRFRYARTAGDDDFIIYPDAFHVDVNYSIKSTYRAEIEHNTTGISWSGTLNSINVSINFSTNATNTPTFNFLIYNFNSGNWEICDTLNPMANMWNMWWCNKVTNPNYYKSTNGVIRIRLNETSHQSLAEVKEDYVQYYVTYTQ